MGECDRTAFLATIVLSVLACGAQAAAMSPAGIWVLDDGTAAIEIGPCGDSICGRIVGVTPSEREAVMTPDGRRIAAGASRRLLCGHTVMEGFRPAGEGIYRGGHIFNPSDGRTYSATLRIESADTLRIRAYVAIEFLGQTRRLHRASPETKLRGVDQCSGNPS
jgi:uncharacterized protein (DUF2147 family)